MSVHEGHRSRVINKFLTQGLDTFNEHQALELLLFFAVPRIDTNQLSHVIIDTFGSLGNAMDAPVEELVKIPGVGNHTATLIKLIPQMARHYELSKLKHGVVLDSRERAGEYCVKLLTGYVKETLFMVCMDNSNRVIATEKLAGGTVSEASVSQRTVAEQVLKHGATRVILAHNHPAGTLAPSASDKAMTRSIAAMLKMLGVELLDHIIVGRGKYTAMFDHDL